MDEALTTDELQRAPLLTPLQHVPPNETNRNFLNYEERALAASALQKLTHRPHQNLEDIFKVRHDFLFLSMINNHFVFILFDCLYSTFRIMTMRTWVL